MKKFDNPKDAFQWAQDVIATGCFSAEEIVAEQIYKDSNEFTYRESGDMYESGETHSKFKKGIITERTPYVRRRYYEGGKAGSGNKKAQPRWFERTVEKYRDNYKEQAKKRIDEMKGKVWALKI